MLVVTTLIAAAGWIFTKEAIQGMPIIGFMALRFIFAAVIIFPLCISTHQKISFSNIPKAVGLGSLQTVQMLFWVIAVSTSSSLGEGAFILSLSILLVPLVVWLLFKEKPLSVFWVSLPIAISGLLFLSLTNGWTFSIGQLWFLGSAIALALYFTLNARLLQKIAIFPLTCIQFFCNAVICSVLSFLFEDWPEAIPLSIWAWFFASVIIATCLRYVLQAVGQKHVNIGNAAIIMILEPIWTLLFSVVFYDEPMPWMKWVGCTLIFVALVIYRGYVFLRTRRSKIY
ncbi:DMT family transporter [Zophobihabitans entericus]|uniref:DMT family transporter n=2 Tax=Zophobihabitans entericus TaxID=1635327 RepID=A0A6G9IEU5_9GAMM|nr:DMT family transporter [Zophobihabitans entericus]